MPYSKGYFDRILSYGVIEHFPDGPDIPLSKLYDALAPGGIATITVPSFNIVRKIGYFFSFFNIVRFLDFKKNDFIRRLFNKKPYPIKKNGKRFGYYINPQYGGFFEYRLTKKQFENLCKKMGFEILESLPFNHIDGLYHCFGRLFFSKDKRIRRFGNIANKIMRKIPYFHNHMHACVLKKPNV